MAITRRQTLIAAGALAVTGAGGALLWRRQQQHAAQMQQAAQIGFTRLDGGTPGTARLADWHGRALLLNFWATSCSTCVAEMPLLAAIYREFAGPRFDALALAMDYDPPDQVIAFARSRELPFPVGHDASGEVARAMGPVYLTPTTLLLDASGALFRRYLGPPDPAQLRAAIAQITAA
ncbi:TlpA family protein disulfide reductase [Amphibiibacter pelophylacis]|uniref:TlpA disulfide reductase family protein n=1 Tax=Amphibiibacter pelophylacis TaxID=1799477 RepID=A0ACC6P4S7_9BURK